MKSRIMGSLVLECLIVFPTVVLPILGFLLAWILLAILRLAILVDCFFLARSHLYGNQSPSCQPASFWPQGIVRESITLNCSGNGFVEFRFHIPSKNPFFPELLLKEQISLLPLDSRFNERSLW